MVLKFIMDKLFGETLPPSSSDGDDAAWEQRKHNKTLRRQVPASKADIIRIADRRSQERYEQMDNHIDNLKKMARASRKRKEQMRALKAKKANG